MEKPEMIDLVERYFAAVDGEDFPAIAAIMTPDCVFTVETHGVTLQGPAEIEGMFRRLWADHASVRHQDFTHVADSGAGRVASRFTVINTGHDGGIARKSNCNFFEIRDRRFSRIAVYMAGENTLRHDVRRG